MGQLLFHALCFRSSLVLVMVFFLKANGQNTECNDEICETPDCYCPTTSVPKGLDPANVPQMVIMSFNGPITYKHREYIDKIFTRRRKNPNGTPIRMTLFVSDDESQSDYCSVNRLWAGTNEIASFSVSRKTPKSFWAEATQEEWEAEIDGQKETLIEEAMIPANDIRGFRSPLLQTGGNEQYKFAVDKGYLFDSSVVLPVRNSVEGREPMIWPYTMDFPNGFECYTEPCPDGNFPDFWQIPVQPLLDLSRRQCIYLDGCPSPPRSSDEVFTILMNNFNHSYSNNRAPLMVNFLNYKKWFDESEDWAIDGINRFIEEVLSFESDDVYFITYSDLIGWMNTPTELRIIRPFAAFGRIQKKVMECEERIDPRPFVNGVALVVIETIIFAGVYLYLYIKEKQD